MKRHNKTASETFRVGLVLQTGQAHMRGVSRGVFRFLQEQADWQIVGEGHYPLLRWNQLRNWSGDGMIAIPNSRSQVEVLRSKGIPVVIAGSRFLESGFVSVACDSQQIGVLAAEHLLNCGLKNFLFVGELKWANERKRHEAFADRVAAAGLRCETVTLQVGEYVAPDASAHYRPDLAHLRKGLQSIAKPFGVCAPNSVLARTVVDVARDCGLDVPDDVAVIGVNDDPLVCDATKPRLSAVVQPSEQIGFEAAQRLDQLMRGQGVASRQVFYPPLGVAARRSTDVLAIDDEDVRAALRFIQDHAHDPIEVADILKNVAVSRRTLETKFRKLLGRTPALELRRVRIEQAKKLLVETTEPITSVVFTAGFNSRQVFSNLFRREVGMTPSAYRRLFRRHLLG